MLDCHVSAFLIVPGRVFGRKLRHLTLAHYWLLEACGSSYPLGTERAVTEAIFAALICSLPARVGRWLVLHPRIMSAVVAVWSWRARRFNLFREFAEFNKYWDAYTARPDAIIRADQRMGPVSCLPSSISIAWTVMERVGERRAWSMPLPLAMSYFVAAAEYNGREYMSEWGKAMARANAEREGGKK